MKALHRILVTGTIGGLAALIVAASGAFACTALATVSIYAQDSKVAPLTVKPGEVVDVEISLFETTGDFSKVRLFIDQPTAGVQSEVTLLDGPGDGFSWVVPPLEKSTTAYNLVAVQVNPTNGEIVGRASRAFTVWEGPLPTRQPTATFPPPPTTTGPQPPLPPSAPGEPDRQPVPEQAGLPAGSARDMLPSTESLPAAAGNLPVAVGGPAAEQLAASGLVGAGSPPPEDQRAPVVAGQPQAPAADLWSGLDGGGPPASLLDVASPPARGGGLLGGALLGAGIAVLALAGLGIGVSRRRLALVQR